MLEKRPLSASYLSKAMPLADKAIRSLERKGFIVAEQVQTERDPLRAPSERLRVELKGERGETKLNKPERGHLGKNNLPPVRLMKEVGIVVDAAGDAPTDGNGAATKVGDRVLAVGAPFGLAGSVTHGIISAKSRNLKLNLYEDFLQTDAAINPGNSGGPLISLDGKVIGINSAIKSRSGGFQGVGMAISSNLARTIMNQLLKDGIVHRGYLGIGIREVDREVAEKLQVKENQGLLVTRVFPDSPSAKTGLKPGDIVTTIAGKPVHDGAELQKIILGLPVGQSVEVAYLRDGKAKTAKVLVEDQPDDFGYVRSGDDD